MEFPKLGEHCEVPNCNRLDFLPIQCDLCRKTFCKDHNLPSYHSCTSTSSNALPEPTKQFYECSIESCKMKEPTPIECDECKLNFCVKHRHPSNHDCHPIISPLELEKRKSKEEAEAVARKTVEDIMNKPTGVKPIKTSKKKDNKLANKVRLMKLKMKAVTLGSTVPQESRIYLQVCLPLKVSKEKCRSVAVCVDQKWSVGRTLDAVCLKSSIENKNQFSNDRKLRLFRHFDASCLVPSKLLEELVLSESLCQGDVLILEETTDTTLPETPESYNTELNEIATLKT